MVIFSINVLFLMVFIKIGDMLTDTFDREAMVIITEDLIGMRIGQEHINEDIPIHHLHICSYAKGNFPSGDHGIFHWVSYCSAELDPSPEYLQRRVYANATWGSRLAYQSFLNTPNTRQKSDSIWQHVHILS
jgi:hypothetical protein